MTESITELPPLEERPLVTFALFAYNQEKYIREAVEGAFAQTYEPLEIILSDDCSADRTFEIMKEMAAEYRGPHRIILNRNIQNLNIGGHVNKVSNLANGDLVVLAAGDDISVSIRTEKLFNFWDSRGRPTAVLCSDFMPINNFSKTVLLSNESTYFGPFDIISMARGYVRILGATTAFSRNIFTAFAPMNASVIHEDKVLPFRALLLGGTISAMTDKLVYYRVTGGHLKDAQEFRKRLLVTTSPQNGYTHVAGCCAKTF